MPIKKLSQHSPSARAQTGFTLIELMIVVTLLGIFATIAVPSLNQFVNKSRTQSFNNDLVALLQYARATAVEQRTFIRVCKGAKSLTVQRDCTKGAPIRELTIPGTLSLNASANEALFRYNGTGTDNTWITCLGDDAANGFTTEAKASGSIQSWPRGKNGTASDMKACK